MTEAMIDLPAVIAKSDDTGFLRELIQDAAQRLMDIEVGAVCGAGLHERTPDRENQRNGYRARRWDTRAGTIGLNIPKLRKGSYFPTFLEPRRSVASAAPGEGMTKTGFAAGAGLSAALAACRQGASAARPHIRAVERGSMEGVRNRDRDVAQRPNPTRKRRVPRRTRRSPLNLLLSSFSSLSASSRFLGGGAGLVGGAFGVGGGLVADLLAGLGNRLGHFGGALLGHVGIGLRRAADEVHLLLHEVAVGLAVLGGRLAHLRNLADIAERFLRGLVGDPKRETVAGFVLSNETGFLHMSLFSHEL